jgi:transposase
LLRARLEKKLYVVMDNHPVHRSHAVRDWAEQKAKRIRIVDLPTDSPELNPVEYLNNEVKANTQKSYRARDPKELETQLRTYLDETRQHDEQSDRYFLVEPVLYAA